jgi:hypothetical protein
MDAELVFRQLVPSMMNRQMPLCAANSCSEPVNQSSSELEAAARAAIGSLGGRPINDQEWTRMSARLLEVTGILRDWVQRTTRGRRDNVEVLCPREL